MHSISQRFEGLLRFAAVVDPNAGFVVPNAGVEVDPNASVVVEPKPGSLVTPNGLLDPIIVKSDIIEQ